MAYINNFMRLLSLQGMSRRLNVGSAVGFCCVLAVVPSLAEDEVELFYGYYEDNSGLEVVTPSISIAKDISEKTTLGAKYTYEKFEKAAPDNALDAVSGATTVAGGTGSGFSEVRQEKVFGATHEFGTYTLSAGYVGSNEEDFESDAWSIALSREMFQKNFTLTGMVSFTHDEINKLDKAPAEEFPQDKDTRTVTLAATQLINPQLLITGGYSSADISGFQSQPLRKINVDILIPGGRVGYIYDERHPETRDRNTFFLRVKKYFMTKTSGDINFSHYNDDWGVKANAVDFRASQYLRKDLVARIRYRLYTQSEADFYQEEYNAVSELMTADTRLREFTSTLSGLKLTYYPKRLQLADWSISLSYDKYRETNNGISADIWKVSTIVPY